MAVTQYVEPVPSVLEESFVKVQPTGAFDTYLAMAATDAVAHLQGSFKIDPTVNFAEVKESVGTASHQGEVKTTQGGAWSGSFYCKPGALGTAPDITALLLALCGVETVGAGVDVVYSLSDTVKTSLQGMLHVENHAQRTFSGGVVEQGKINITNGELVTFDFSGSFARSGHVFRDTNSAAEPEGKLPFYGNCRANLIAQHNRDMRQAYCGNLILADYLCKGRRPHTKAGLHPETGTEIISRILP